MWHTVHPHLEPVNYTKWLHSILDDKHKKGILNKGTKINANTEKKHNVINDLYEYHILKSCSMEHLVLVKQIQ